MSDYRIIDISIWMDAFVFPGNPEISICGPNNRVTGDNPEYVYDLELCSQSGTHIQGAHYFLENGSRINDYPLSHFEGPAYVLDCDKRGKDITEEELKEQLSTVDLKDKILILRTGHMDELLRDQMIIQKKRPGLSLGAARYLCEKKGIKMIAIDSLGVESRLSKNYDVNVYLCNRGILILECLANLNKIQAREVFLEAYPLKIKGVEGTPCRAIIKEPFY